MSWTIHAITKKATSSRSPSTATHDLTAHKKSALWVLSSRNEIEADIKTGWQLPG
jgi:hypothetical protein